MLLLNYIKLIKKEKIQKIIKRKNKKKKPDRG
jgi:hypothetical protein